ncbi:MAG: YutD family protein [Lysinibacillus sp.]
MTIVVDGYAYEIIENVKDGFKEENFLARYSEVLQKYDYIVGDWGYGQLRLKGFFDDRNQKSTFDTKISTFQDYLYEYCNFGCAYFIVKKIGKEKQPKPVEIVDIEAEQVEV